MANLEVALDSRRFNPQVRVVMRLFDQRIADKFKDVKLIDEAFSAAALAAPLVADLARRRKTCPTIGVGAFSRLDAGRTRNAESPVRSMVGSAGRLPGNCSVVKEPDGRSAVSVSVGAPGSSTCAVSPLNRSRTQAASSFG